MPELQLHISDVAAILGIAASTWRSRVSRAQAMRRSGRDRPGLAPPPDGHHVAGVIVRPWWTQQTIMTYAAGRVGQGSRRHVPLTTR